ncbi:hypothetical protein MNBD_GAMMA08-2213 [hydrothermal vent metagenome]|uniref:DUF2147 domain-containing protein n=1 Tax=hydrothermal vent metagenome TaxID=652676 RepID=A0A3B0XF21_9ZZZZ
MKKVLLTCTAVMSLGVMSSAMATNEITSMIGTWKWEGFTIEVAKCDATEVCAKVISGPKNVGMQMIKSKLKPDGNSFLGQVAHPQTGDTYNSKLTMATNDTWHIDGCTTANVCASGDFSRVK